MKKQILLLFTSCIAAYSSYAQAPNIISFSPASGPVGTLVHITGTNLSSPTAFTIGGVSAIVVSDADTTLVGMVMPGAATGTVSVTTLGGTAIASGSFTITHGHFPTTQQGPKLVGTGAVGQAVEGVSVAISADGNTAIVGGSLDNNYTGAAWIFTRSDTTWTQQGIKLIGTGAVGTAVQGVSVAISADGNTAIVGGPQDNDTGIYANGTGAAWVYSRSGTIWTQQGGKLVGTGAIGAAVQGRSVSLSADGNTAIVGGPEDNTLEGAAWVYSRSGTTWTQQGPKLVGTGAVGYSYQGYSVSLSADGNTAIVGGDGDNNIGAAWVFSRSGTTWTQQGSKLVGIGAVGQASEGVSVALSADGNTAIVGGPTDNNDTGAVWIYSRSGTTWTQQGNKLVSSTQGYNVSQHGPQQGWSVSLSADGNTAIVGGNYDNNFVGAAWVYIRSGSIWPQQGIKLVGTGAVGSADQGVSVALSADGTTTMVGGEQDNVGIGATWVFSLSCSPDSSFTSFDICQNNLPYSWNGLTFTQAGRQTAILTNSGGCDSIVTLHLTVNPLPVVTLTWDSLVGLYNIIPSNEISGDTTWCQTLPYIFRMRGGSPGDGIYSGQFINNDTINFHLWNNNHNVDTITYAYIDSNGCKNHSINYLYYDICEGIQNISGASPIHLYPNPNTGTFTLETSQMMNATYTISDMLGQVIRQEAITSDSQLIDIGAAPVGIYMLSISGLSGSVKFAVLK